MRTGMTKGTTWVALLGLAFAPLSASAAEAVKAEETPAARMQREVDEQLAETRTLSHKMMGHVNLAELAIDVNLEEAALDHVRVAQKIASQLQGEAPQVIDKTEYKYGKISYEFEDETKHYYVPVIDDVYLLSDYRDTHRAFRSDEIEEIDAGVVEVTISVDLREVQSALGNAEKSLEAKDLLAARLALAGIFKNAITDEEVVTDPVWAVHDNIALASNLVESENYDSARMALEHAKKRLAELEKKSDVAEAKKEFRRMHESITRVQRDLRKKDPSLRERISDRFSSWMGTVGGWD